MKRVFGLLIFGLFMGLAVLMADTSPAVHAAEPSAKEKPIGPADLSNPFQNWQADKFRDHLLVGKIWSRKTGGMVSVADFSSAIARADYVLLGEIHDNPDAHRIQAWGLETRTKGNRKPAVVMEMLNDGQQPALDAFFGAQSGIATEAGTLSDQRAPAQASDLFDKLNWKQSGWPDAKMYSPIIEAALRAGSRLYPASSSRKVVRNIGSHGFKDLSARKKRELHLDRPLAKPLLEALAVELKEGHCGMLPDRAIPAMSRVQRYRDATMALVMIDQGGDEGAVLIAGNGHVRTDRAVPWYLARMLPNGKTMLSVSIVEVDDKSNDIADYLPKDADGKAAADFVVFTPRQSREDPCEQMRKMFKQIKQQKENQKRAK